MAIPISYNLKNLQMRSEGAFMAIGGIALVVATFILVFALADGFQKILASTGSEQNVLILRYGATAEILSEITREQASVIKAHADEFAEKSEDGMPLVSAEVVLVINQPKIGSSDERSNVNLRGMAPNAQKLRPALRLVQGRWLEPGKGELVAGIALGSRVQGTKLGESILFANRSWKIVGIVDSGGSYFDSELFGDSEEFLNSFARNTFQSVTMRLKNTMDFDKLKNELGKEQTLKITVQKEKNYYDSLAAPFRSFVIFVGMFICSIMSFGSILGIVNAMNATISTRVREIGTLRTLGFSRLSILFSFLIEILILSFLGGLIGCLISLAFDGIQAGTTADPTFTEMAFSIHVDKVNHFFYGILFALGIGSIGGIIPAIQGSNKKIVNSLREI